jgi:hypothetical protein
MLIHGHWGRLIFLIFLRYWWQLIFDITHGNRIESEVCEFRRLYMMIDDRCSSMDIVTVEISDFWWYRWQNWWSMSTRGHRSESEFYKFGWSFMMIDDRYSFMDIVARLKFGFLVVLMTVDGRCTSMVMEVKLTFMNLDDHLWWLMIDVHSWTCTTVEISDFWWHW